MVPKSIRAMKPEPEVYGSCKVRAVSGGYYVYEVRSVWDKARKKSVKESGKCLGKITERDGFIPNAYALSLHATSSDAGKERITVLSYGAYELLMQLSPSIDPPLREFFPDCFREIWTLALLRLIDGVGPRLMHPTFMDSYMSRIAPDLPMSENSVRGFVRSLGTDVDRIESFMRSSIMPGTNLVFDGTHFFADARDSLAQKGYNPDRKRKKQIRLLYIFDETTYRPQFYQVLQGSAVDRTAFIDIIKASGCTRCTILGDKGFYSKKNVSLLMNSGLDLSYILPLNANTKLVDEKWLKNPDKDKFDSVFVYHDRPIFSYRKPLGKDGNWVYTFFDPERALQKDARDLTQRSVRTDETVFTDFSALSARSGYFSYVCNMETDGRQVYLGYKKRGSIETCFDYLKNVVHAGPSYAHTDEGIRGWAFLNHISLLYFYGLVAAMRKTKLDERYSPDDVILLCKHVYAIQSDTGTYDLSHVQKKTQDLLDLLHVNLEEPLRLEAAQSPIL